MNPSIELTLEQEFSLRDFTDQVRRMSREQAQEFLIAQYRLMLIQNTTYQELLKQSARREYLSQFLSP
ncbi:NblA/ycf18 family protein [Leptolyngbya sp. AN03gr2]|uniref:NblA/ycf18 family protein n=1 Tax=unclassified Leptolyngbya TaxID=2650499 RepID=UPI003D320315